MSILADIKQIQATRSRLRSFGLLIGSLLILFGAYHFFFANASWIAVGYIGLALALLAVALPVLLTPLYWVWMVIAVVLGYVMSRVILTVLFYLVITPIGLLSKIFGHHFMTLRPDKQASTYWEPRRPIDPKSIEKQY